MKTLKAFLLTAVLAFGLVTTPLMAFASSHNPSYSSTISAMDQMPTPTPIPAFPDGPGDCSGGCLD